MDKIELKSTYCHAGTGIMDLQPQYTALKRENDKLHARVFHLEKALLKIGTWPSFCFVRRIKKYAMKQLESSNNQSPNKSLEEK